MSTVHHWQLAEPDIETILDSRGDILEMRTPYVAPSGLGFVWQTVPWARSPRLHPVAAERLKMWVNRRLPRPSSQGNGRPWKACPYPHPSPPPTPCRWGNDWQATKEASEKRLPADPVSVEAMSSHEVHRHGVGGACVRSASTVAFNHASTDAGSVVRYG